MQVDQYYSRVLQPANVACSAMRMAGIPISVERSQRLIADFDRKIADLEHYLEGAAAEAGVSLRFTPKHGCNREALIALLFTAPRGLGLEVRGRSAKTKAISADDAALKWYASLTHPRPDDHPVVAALLKLRSLAGAKAKYLVGFLEARRADGCIHPKSNWGTVRTARLSMEDPPVQQIPERSDPEVVEAVHSTFVPRLAPAPEPADWNPRKHGFFFRWDVAGAEAVIRAAVQTHRLCTRSELTLWEYIRLGKDMHARTAALLEGGDEWDYAKENPRRTPAQKLVRDALAKVINFVLLYGGGASTVQKQLWKKARRWVELDVAQRYADAFFAGVPELPELYELGKAQLGEHGYVEDGYGRRRAIPLPAGVRYLGTDARGITRWSTPPKGHAEQQLEECFHIAANTPTQSMCASSVLWMLALLHLGEYTPLAVPPMWERGGIPFPEARGWRLDGESIKAWSTNTVHDSGWGDGGPGELERTAKVIWRRCQSVPWDWLLDADVPLRIELKVGPDGAHLSDYNTVATTWGLEPLPIR